MFLGYASPQDFKFPSFCQACLLATSGTRLRHLISERSGPYTAILTPSELDGYCQLANNPSVYEDPVAPGGLSPAQREQPPVPPP
jgi:hypothetical protein